MASIFEKMMSDLSEKLTGVNDSIAKSEKNLEDRITASEQIVIEHINSKYNELNEHIVTLENRISSLENEYAQKFLQIETDLATKSSDLFSKVQKKVDELMCLRTEVEQKSNNLDFNSRRKNVVLFKIAEKENNSFELQRNVHDLVKTIADASFKESDIDFIQRLGKKGAQPRPILLALTKVSKRNFLLTRSKNFLNKRIRIDEDLPKNIMIARKPIYKLADKLRKEGKKVFFKREKFFVEGAEWQPDQIEQELSLLPTYNQN